MVLLSGVVRVMAGGGVGPGVEVLRGLVALSVRAVVLLSLLFKSLLVYVE